MIRFKLNIKQKFKQKAKPLPLWRWKLWEWRKIREQEKKISKKIAKKDAFLYFSRLLQKKNLAFFSPSHELEIQTAFYRLLKFFYRFKAQGSLKISSEFFGFLPQESYLFTSFSETKKKKQKILIKEKTNVQKILLKEEVSQKKAEKRGKFSFPKPSSSKTLSFIKGRKSFLNYKTKRLKSFDVRKKTGRFLKLFQRRRIYKNILKRRVLLHALVFKKKKRYKKFCDFLKRSEKRFVLFLRLYSRNRTNYIIKRKRKKKTFKRLIRKWNRKRKWKRRGLFRFFRSGLRFHNKFSIPKHFEMNPKTGEILYLGFADSASLNFRLPFSLNLRRMVTLFSF